MLALRCVVIDDRVRSDTSRTRRTTLDEPRRLTLLPGVRYTGPDLDMSSGRLPRVAATAGGWVPPGRGCCRTGPSLRGRTGLLSLASRGRCAPALYSVARRARR